MRVENIIDKLENKEKLTYEEIDFMVSNYTKGKITDEEMSKFLMIIKNNSLSYEETFYLTKSMVNSGDILDLSKIDKVIVDKHSTGGVGDKVTLIISPIVASLGLGVAKMSGRSLGFTGGTIDKLESIPGYQVNISNEQFIDNINKIGISIISQTGKLAPADKKIYALRDEIDAVESIPLIASSIMSKKIASSSPIIVIDLKVGKGAFMKNIEESKQLAEYMIKIGEFFNRKVECLLTNMDCPLGYTVGNSIEVKEAEDFFLGKREKRLEKLVIELSSIVVSLGKKINIEEAKKEVLQTINNGNAKAKFYEWIKTQNGDITKLQVSNNTIIIKSNKKGYITEIDPLKISELVMSLGAGRAKKEDKIDLSVGIELLKTLYEEVDINEPLIKIYYKNYDEDLIKKALNAFKIESIIENKKDIIISRIN